MDVAEQWLSREDETFHAERVERLRWLATQAPSADYLTFPGGLLSKYIFEETRYCFAYGQYLAVIVLGVAFVERILAAEFYASGRNDMERSGISELPHDSSGYFLFFTSAPSLSCLCDLCVNALGVIAKLSKS